MATLEDTIKRLDSLNLQQPEFLCWVILDGEYHYNPYCPECAEKIVDYCLNGFGDKNKEIYLGKTYLELPSEEEYGDVTSAYYVEAHDLHTDGVEICHVCGKHLSVILTESGVGSELDHFEIVDIDTKQELREIYDIFWALEYSHGEECKHYDRAIKLAERIEPMIAELEEEKGKE